MTVVGLSRFGRSGIGALLLLAVAVGCASIRVRKAERPSLFSAWRASAVSKGELSPRSQQTLRRWGLALLYRRSPGDAAARLHAEALREPTPDLLFALAEISFLEGGKVETRHHSEAVVYYYLCAGYSYHYLFNSTEGAQASLADGQAFDPRFRLACDLYNASLAKCIDAAQHAGQLDPRRQLRLSGEGKGELAIVHAGFALKPEEFGPLLFCADYEVVGLANHHRTYGLGVPLIGTRAANVPRPAGAYYPPHVSFPVTAFFRFEGGLAELGERRAGRLELYNPLAVQAAQVKGRPVPLETDLTTPLAHYLAHTNLAASGYTGFLRPEALASRAGIYMLEPYQPGKIPVVLVHGLLASPLTWAPVYNDLQADPELRRRFQFWAYFYPTGSPYLFTAADLRRDLAKLRTTVDPQKRDAALDEMVFVGHSMGGLVSKLTSVQGGDDFWQLEGEGRFADLKLKPEVRSELEQVFYFEPVSSVKRVIFLATPHRGSQISPSLLGRAGAGLVRLPRTLLAAAQDVIVENPNLGASQHGTIVRTSIALLAPDAPALKVLAARQPPRGVRYHSIVGIAPPGMLRVERWFGGGAHEVGDGVVPYASAHLEGAVSELVVPADHYEVHHHPLAILEVRRILLEHLRETAPTLQRVGGP